MRILPRKWDVKTIGMRESEELSKLEFHDLFVDLKSYELELGIQIEEDPSTSVTTKALIATVVAPLVERTSRKNSAEQLSNEVMSLT